MIMNELEEIVQGAFRRVFRLDAIPKDASPASIKEWDSLNHLNLMLELESALGIEISIQQYPEMTSYQAIVEILVTLGVANRL